MMKAVRTEAEKRVLKDWEGAEEGVCEARRKRKAGGERGREEEGNEIRNELVVANFTNLPVRLLPSLQLPLSQI